MTEDTNIGKGFVVFCMYYMFIVMCAYCLGHCWVILAADTVISKDFVVFCMYCMFIVMYTYCLGHHWVHGFGPWL